MRWGMIKAPVQPASADNDERRLLAEYETASKFYSWAVAELARQRGTVSRDEFVKLNQVAKDARSECERIRCKFFKLKDSGPSG